MSLTITLIVPSLIVRRRLARRYHLKEELLDIQIIESSCIRNDGTTLATLELFMLLQKDIPNAAITLQERERTHENEKHFAFVPHYPSSTQNIIDLLKASGFVDDGGGINPLDNEQKMITYLSHVANKRTRRIEIQTYPCEDYSSFS